jgi:indoleamine 2,3-dioxygenase
MPERCDPYIYFHRVRPYIHGWKDNPALGAGLVYQGVAETRGEPQAFRGQTGAQSSIVPALDALLGIRHAQDPLRTYLDELHAYRPPAHRRFIDGVRAQSRLRFFVAAAGHPALREAYNECVIRLARFPRPPPRIRRQLHTSTSEGSVGRRIRWGWTLKVL